mgnify:CR=1 FL=1
MLTMVEVSTIHIFFLIVIILNVISLFMAHITMVGRSYYGTLNTHDKIWFNILMFFSGIIFWGGRLYITAKYKIKIRKGEVA